MAAGSSRLLLGQLSHSTAEMEALSWWFQVKPQVGFSLVRPGSQAIAKSITVPRGMGSFHWSDPDRRTTPEPIKWPEGVALSQIRPGHPELRELRE